MKIHPEKKPAEETPFGTWFYTPSTCGKGFVRVFIPN